jgi:uncharacterized tellurite resistance protein B-like protein
MSQEIDVLADYTREERLQFCRIVAHMVGADRKFTEDERIHLAALVWQAGLSMDEEDVAAAIQAEIDNPTPLADLVKGVDNPEMRRWLYRILIEVALADNHLDKEEESKLVELAGLFSLNSEAARDLIHWTQDSIALERREMEIMSKL